MITSLRAELAVDSQDTIGEGPTWDAHLKRLLWSDHALGVIHEATCDSPGRWRENRRWELRRPIAATIPRAKGGLIVASGTDILRLEEGDDPLPFANISPTRELERINDAKCDRRGRLWAGTMNTDFREGAAALYRIDADGHVTRMLDGLTIANGLDWSPDGLTLYCIDSFTRRIDAFDFDEARGEITNRRTVLTMTSGTGIPNGMTVDTEGYLWVAATGAGEVQRYSLDGILLMRVTISTPGATSCAFGGRDGGDLCITSRSGRMPEIARALGLTDKMMENNSSQAGALYVCRPGVIGMAANPFAG
jgi:sugar lactone lactonase YvrE